MQTNVTVRYRLQSDQVDVAISAIKELVSGVLAMESDCGGITILQDDAEPTRVMLSEKWTSKDTFLGPHMQQPYIQSFIAGAGAFMAGPPDISFWHDVNGE